jgi:single-strand DNA-binding protein
MNINKALIAGRLTKDPVVRTTQTGQTVAQFSIATSEKWKDKQGQKQEKATFHNIVVWGRLAEIAGQYLTKGQECYIEGRIETRDYTGKDGIKRYVTEIVGNNLQMGNKPQGYAAPAPTAPSTPAKEEEIPTINLDEDPNEVKIEDVPF